MRTAPAGEDEQWVSCDWSVRTLGAIISRRDIAALEAEGRGLQALLGGEKDVSNFNTPSLQDSHTSAGGGAGEFRPHQIACVIGLSIVAVLGMALGSIGTWAAVFVRIKAHVDGPPGVPGGGAHGDREEQQRGRLDPLDQQGLAAHLLGDRMQQPAAHEPGDAPGGHRPGRDRPQGA